MILAINIGNTNTVLGCIDGSKCVFVERISTVKTKTELEYAIDIKNVLDIYHIKKADLEGGIISSVVPQITMVVKAAVEKILKKEVLIVGAGIKTGLNIRIDNPAQLGSDLVVGAVAGIAEYPTPLLIFDMGTATTISVIDEHAEILGVVIFPGVRTSLNALTANAAQLLDVGVEAPPDIIGTNTIDSMKSGIVYGTASMIDGIIERMRERLGRDLTVVATGGHSAKITPYCRNQVIVNPNLLLEGLYKLYKKNS